MELRQIRSFLSIAETLHFGRTAELVHLSQPALSLQIRALEEEIGVRLFERNRRKTTLTAAGAAFREAAAAAVLQLDQAIRRATLAANGKLGLLSIGFISTAGSELVPNVIRLFRELNPDVQFSLRKRVRLSEVASQDFVMYERTHAPGFHDLVFGMLRKAGIVPHVSQTAGEMPTLISLVDAGMGLSILPASAVRHSVASVVACEIADAIPMSEIGIAVSKDNRTAVVDTFRSFALNKLVRSK